MAKKSKSRNWHKWLGLGISLIIVIFAISGVILNHRKVFSPYDVNRSYLADNYQYKNWNLSAVKSSLKLAEDSILVYGNVGVYLSDSLLTKLRSFNEGFEEGIDNRKIEKVFKTKDGKLLASTIFNLHEYSFENKRWEKIDLPFHNQRIVDIAEDDKGLLLLSRSELIRTSDLITFQSYVIPAPKNYDNKVGLFKTLWVIHSGEIYGETGKIIVDIFGIIFSILVISGIFYFILPKRIKRKKKKDQSIKNSRTVLKTSVKWHNKLGWSLGLFLIITTLTGMFLRPPLLIAIANSKVSKIPFTELDVDNAWFDKLRRIEYDEETKLYFLATLDGIFVSRDAFQEELQSLPIPAPISVMGVNVFEYKGYGKLLVGSFSGLFEIDLRNFSFIDYATKRPYVQTSRRGSPIGEVMASGYSDDFAFGEMYFDYSRGMMPIGNKFSRIEMPNEVKDSNMSLWNLNLEIHTARFFQFLLGDFYILFIPLFGIFTIIVLISGYIIWFRKKRFLK